MRADDECRHDVVLDTNVLAHANNPNISYQSGALAVLQWVAETTVRWVLDDQGKSAPDPNTSVMYAEYIRTLPPQGVSLALFIECLANGRVDFAPRPNRDIRQVLRSIIPRNTRDQAVLGAACGSSDRVLISNDFDDFNGAARRRVSQELGVTVLDSDEASE